MEIVRAKNDQKIQWPNAFLFLLHAPVRMLLNLRAVGRSKNSVGGNT